jgi:hypothetical protein
MIHKDLVFQLYSLDDCARCVDCVIKIAVDICRSSHLLDLGSASLRLEKPYTSMVGIDVSNRHTQLSFGPECTKNGQSFFI